MLKKKLINALSSSQQVHVRNAAERLRRLLLVRPDPIAWTAHISPAEDFSTSLATDTILARLDNPPRGLDTAARRAFLSTCTQQNLFCDKTGLVPDVPPSDIHAMARSAGGDAHYADLIAHAVPEIAQAEAVLDFGSSSGRVVRFLQAAFPAAKWSACDPNRQAIAWAQTHLPHIDFFVSQEAPPLARADESFDVIYAVSIWSHFSAPAAERWFQEMHRLLKPGGRLCFSTHGWHSLAIYARARARAPRMLHDAEKALQERGEFFFDIFGAQGDWGVKNADWGESYFSAEWILRALRGRFDVTFFSPGLVESNQDVYVVQKRPA